MNLNQAFEANRGPTEKIGAPTENAGASDSIEKKWEEDICFVEPRIV